MTTLRLVVRMTALAAVALTLVACATEPAPRPRHIERQVVEPPPPPSTTVYSYPLHDQTPEQQDRDRYECYTWAVKQTGFDPSGPNVPERQRVRVVGGPPAGANTAAGAVTGAVLGAAVSRPRDAAGGAIVGAVLGGAVGAAADSAEQDRRHAVEESYRARDQERIAQLDHKAEDFRRAAGACLEGRGYSTR
jgi:hypothetical protein